jgi:ribonuclease HI
LLYGQSIPAENPKTQILRKMLDEEGEEVFLEWVPSHKGITGNEMADIEAKTPLDDVIHSTEKYPSQDLVEWLSTKAIES